MSLQQSLCYFSHLLSNVTQIKLDKHWRDIVGAYDIWLKSFMVWCEMPLIEHCPLSKTCSVWFPFVTFVWSSCKISWGIQYLVPAWLMWSNPTWPKSAEGITDNQQRISYKEKKNQYSYTLWEMRSVEGSTPVSKSSIGEKTRRLFSKLVFSHDLTACSLFCCCFSFPNRL